MHIRDTAPLFAWEALDDNPQLDLIRRFLAVVPDGRLLASLRQWRGRGRDDYPVTVLWGTVLLTVLLRHPTFEATLAELERNPHLREVLGIRRASHVPKAWNVSRFLAVLGRPPNLTLLEEVFNQMIRLLGSVVGDLGQRTAGDSSALSARAGGRANGDGLPEPTGGRKEYTDAQGQVVRVLKWFGYKLHLLVDVKHELALANRITSANVADNEMLGALVAQGQANLPEGRMRTLAYDKAADDVKVHQLLNREGIAPLIENRALWKEELERMLPGHDGTSNVVHDESGTIYCYDKKSDPPVRHRMAYIGHEPSRGTLKYRCPAMHGRWKCPSRSVCNAGKKYGKTVRVKQAIDLRRFPPIPRATKQFERLYKGRTAVERVNGRLKIFWGADDGNITGAARFHAFVGAVMVVHAGLGTLLAAAPRQDGTLGRMRLGPIAKALGEKLQI